MKFGSYDIETRTNPMNKRIEISVSSPGRPIGVIHFDWCDVMRIGDGPRLAEEAIRRYEDAASGIRSPSVGTFACYKPSSLSCATTTHASTSATSTSITAGAWDYMKMPTIGWVAEEPPEPDDDDGECPTVEEIAENDAFLECF